MTKDSMDSFDVWKTWSKLSCGFLRAVSKSPKSLERVIISAPKEKRSLLLRMFGTTIWWSVSVQLVRKWPGENGKLPKISKCYINHSIRTTAVTILDKSGLEARHIMAVLRRISIILTIMLTYSKLDLFKEFVKYFQCLQSLSCESVRFKNFLAQYWLSITVHLFYALEKITGSFRAHERL